MKRRVTINLGNRSFSLISDEPDEITSRVKSRIEALYRDFMDYSSNVPLEEILFVMLANAVLEQVKLEKDMENLLRRLKERIAG